MTTLTLLRGEGWQLLWADDVRALLLMLVVVVSACLSWGLLGRYVSGMRRGLAMGLMVLAQAPAVGAWWLLFWGW